MSKKDFTSLSWQGDGPNEISDRLDEYVYASEEEIEIIYTYIEKGVGVYDHALNIEIDDEEDETLYW